MLSIITNRKTPRPKKSNDSSSTGDMPNQEELINGSLELIDLLYKYIAKDGVGLTYVKATIDASKEHEELFCRFSEFFHNIETAISALTATSTALHTIIDSEVNQSESFLQLQKDCCHDSTAIHTSLGNMELMLKQCSEDYGSLDPGLATLLNGISREVKTIKETEAKKADALTTAFAKYQEIVEKINTTLFELIEKTTQDVALLQAKDELQHSFAKVRTTNMENLSILNKREQDNMVMLNDLLSFLLQLKSILTCLKTELRG